MRLRNLSAVMFMAAWPLLSASPAIETCKCAIQAQDWDFRAEASQLLEQIQSEAAQLRAHAATLKTYTRGGFDWQTHAGQLTLAKNSINEIGERLERLQSIRHAAEPWHSQAIDSIVPVAVNLAGSTESAIQYLKENRNRLWSPAYTGHLNSISERADQVKEYVDLHLEMASTQNKLEQLQGKAALIGL